MVNREIKKGDMVWLFNPHLDKQCGHVVKSVKREGTLVSLIVEAHTYNSTYEIKMYGHASSSLLSGYDRRWGRQDRYYTCEYGLIEDEANAYKRDLKYYEAGRALLGIVKFFK